MTEAGGSAVVTKAHMLQLKQGGWSGIEKWLGGVLSQRRSEVIARAWA